MKKLICALLVVALVFTLVACGTPSEIVKDKKLRKSNFETYLQVDVDFDSLATNYSAYDGDNPDYKGGRWKWGTVNATVKVSPKTANKMEFADCKLTLQVTFGFFGPKNIEVVLDENGCYTETFALESQKSGIPKEGFTSTDYAVPVATYTVIEAQGDMKIHIMLDENGSAITESVE
ncbi:MAG: hypothetical protein IJ946_08880 [Clostridia bacterium]|nr:hypothetical protein [Clostridia bacterium]